MKIMKMAKNKVVMFLSKKNVMDFKIDFDDLTLHKDNRILLRLLSLACLNSDIDIDSKEVLMEALPSVDGMIICFTFMKPINKNYHLCTEHNSIGFYFETVEDFLCCVEKLHNIPLYNRNSVFLFDKNYYLIFSENILPKKAKLLLLEYCSAEINSQKDIAKIMEEGKKIYQNSAVRKIGNALCT